MMVRCAFCQGEVNAGEHFCRHCGHVQPSTVLTAPAEQAAPTKRCPNCGDELPEWAAFCGNCRSTQPLAAQQPRITTPLAPRATAPLEQMRPCPFCGAETPLWARFCGTCSQSLTGSGSISDAATMISSIPIVGAFSGPAAPPAAPGAFPGVPGAYAGPQSGVPGVPGASGGPQSGAPGVPGASGPFQNSAPTMPNAPSAPHSGTQPWQGSSTAARTAGKGVLRGLRYKLLGTVQAKIITAVVVATVVVTAGGATAAYILTRPNPVIQVTSDFHPAGHTAPVGAPMVALHVTGQDFSDNSSVTFALDGKAAPGTHSVSSDGKGNIKTDLIVTTDWRYGSHTLTATDANHYTTKSGVKVEVIPRPLIMVMSQYQQAGTPAGSASTMFHINGIGFSYSRPVTFLLDGQAAPGSHPAQSDANGNVVTDLAVTGNWRVGSHTLTAKDDKGYSTGNGAPVAIVPQGEANTPGPHGAPPDDMSFGIKVAVSGGDLWYFPDSLVITGQADPNGGKVCQQRDNGQTFSRDGPLYGPDGQPNGVTYHETTIATCIGSYKGGHLAYIERATSDQFKLSNGVTCHGNTPRVIQSLDGSFSSSSSISGTWSADPISLSCDQNFAVNGTTAVQDSWSGTTG